MTPEEKQAMREAVAVEYGIAMYRQYNEDAAAHFLGVDVSTMKRRRRKGLVPFVPMGERSVKYLGYQICDMILFGTGALDA